MTERCVAGSTSGGRGRGRAGEESGSFGSGCYKFMVIAAERVVLLLLRGCASWAGDAPSRVAGDDRSAD